MKRTESILGLLLIAAALAAVIAAAVLAVKFGVGQIHHIFDSLDPQTGLLWGLSAVVVLLCSMLIAATLRSAARRQRELWRQGERGKVYQALLDTLAARSNTVAGSATPIDRALFLYGSALVLKEYRALVQLLSAQDGCEEGTRKQVNRLMLAMRRDLGESTFGLETEDWSCWLHGQMMTTGTERKDAPAQTDSFRFAPAAPAHRF